MTESMDQTAAANQSQCDELAAAVLAYCETNHFKIAAAESLTGGLLADAFVRVPGASKVFLGSAVTYDIRAKASILGVDAELLRSEGDGDCVIGLSTTGVAGPGPDGNKPAGLAYVGCSLPEGFGGVRSRRTEAFELRLQGDRESVRRGVVHCILQKLRELSADSQE